MQICECQYYLPATGFSGFVDFKTLYHINISRKMSRTGAEKSFQYVLQP